MNLPLRPPPSLSRREALRAFGASALALGASLLPSRARAADAPAPLRAPPAPTGPYRLPDLPFGYDALEPAIDARTMEIHYTRHHQAYVNNANVALQYRDWLEGGDVKDVEALAPGQGAVVRHGIHRVAVYRAGDGTVHAHSARCPHLGCAVRWSPQEKSWDCPCHGSRFDRFGTVINGPANIDLLTVDVKVT